MAAYAALLSLNHIIEHILQTTHLLTSLIRREQIEVLRENVIFLQEFLEQYHPRRREEEEIKKSESKIVAAAYKAEDIIESCVVDQIRGDLKEDDVNLFHQHFQRVLEEFDSIREDTMEIKEMEGMKEYQRPRISTAETSLTRPAPTGKYSMVGFDDDLVELMEKLTGQRSSLQIISIVGMGGIGKTTLAKNIYDNPFIVQYFHIRAWVTISQEYCIRDILTAILREISAHIGQLDGNLVVFIGKVSEKSDDQLGEKLHKCLSGMRYIIVMDDIWSIDAWNGIRMFFPNNNNGSRILVTTRLSNIALYFPSCSPYQLDFLDEEKSWMLFCNRVFEQEEVCPLEMEAIGKEIVKKCRGLPLAIVTISGLIANSNITKEYWKRVAEDMNSIVNSANDGYCMKVLALSYHHLPVHLKPCFLYMGTFPEDYEIRISELIRLWVAEGFLKRVPDKNLEEIAMDYLTDLVDRNLILVCKYGSNGKMKTCTLHDLLRDLCLKEAHKERFFQVTRMNYWFRKNQKSIQSERRLIIHGSNDKVQEDHPQVLDASNSASFPRSLIRKGFNGTCPKLPHSNFRLLRIFSICETYCCEDIFELVNSRYLAFTVEKLYTTLNPFKSLSRFWNLQSIIVTSMFQGLFGLPSEIWEMRQLRHLKIDDVVLPDPHNLDSLILENILTLSTITDLCVTEDVLNRIQNVRKLGLCYERVNPRIQSLVKLLKLESLSLRCNKYVLQSIAFPRSLKKLTLCESGLPWENMTIIGSLPDLEVLKLRREAFEGPNWNPVEGEFLKLKFLLIEDSDLNFWSADKSHFPELETLVLSRVYELKEIPSGIGEIPTLRLIRLSYCSDSAAASAKQMQEEQKDLGNEAIHVEVFKCKNWNMKFLEIHLSRFKWNHDLR